MEPLRQEIEPMFPCHTTPSGKGFWTPPPPRCMRFFTAPRGYRGLVPSPQYLCAGTLAPGAEVIVPSNRPGPSIKGASPQAPVGEEGRGAGGLGPLLPAQTQTKSSRVQEFLAHLARGTRIVPFETWTQNFLPRKLARFFRGTLPPPPTRPKKRYFLVFKWVANFSKTLLKLWN